MSDAKHTPGPWAINPIPTDDEGWEIESAPGTNPSAHDLQGAEWIATVYDGTCDAPGPNAEFIVRACNAHAELLAACEAATKALRLVYKQVGAEPKLVSNTNFALSKCCAAVAKAKGTP